jgi:putative CocE/NonD family hydrolase
MHMIRTAIILFITLLQSGLYAQQDKWELRTEMIPMRDGKKLFTKIYTPRDNVGELPILMLRTPYGIGNPEDFNHQLDNTFKYLAEDGYIFVFQDARGKYGSEGEFVMMRPVALSEDQIDEGTDAFDTIDWLIKNIEGNNGRVGIFGISYDGWLTVMAALKPHPALKAVSPQASPADMYLMDDFSHKGAFRLSPTFGYTYLVGTSSTSTPFPYDQRDTYEWFLDLGPIKNASKFLKGAEEGWVDFERHPDYDEFWQKQNVLNYMDQVNVPVLNVVGWWDAEDFYGSMEIYKKWEENDTGNINFLAVGPWRHGNWWGKGDTLGPLTFSPDPSEFYRKNIEAPFFRYYLRNEGEDTLPNAWVYQTGADVWRKYDEWPVSNRSEEIDLFLAPGKNLSLAKPGINGMPYTQYFSDPDNPVPYAPRPIPGFWQDAKSKWKWKLADQRFVQYRPDVVHFETEPLEEDVVISGDIIMHLYASTTGSDADWVIKLIDVYPEDFREDPNMAGYQLMIADEVLRGRYREEYETGKPIPPDEILEYTVELNNRHHRFRKGHRIMIQIQSTWFPLIDRNPQRFVNIYEAEEQDFISATHRIYHSPEYPSHISFPVLRSPEPVVYTLDEPEVYSGIFINENVGKIEVKAEDGSLNMYLNDNFLSELEYVKGTLFTAMIQGVPYRVIYLAENNTVSGLKIMVSDHDSSAKDLVFSRK